MAADEAAPEDGAKDKGKICGGKCGKMVVKGAKCVACSRLCHPGCLEHHKCSRDGQDPRNDQDEKNDGPRGEEVTHLLDASKEHLIEIIRGLKSNMELMRELLSTKEELITAKNIIIKQYQQNICPCEIKKSRRMEEAKFVNTPAMRKDLEQSKTVITSKNNNFRALEIKTAEKMAEIINLNNENDKDQWRKVEYKKAAEKKPCIGTSKVKINELTGSTKLAWLHVGKCASSATVNMVRGYVERKEPKIQVKEVEMLESKGTNKSFKLAVDYEHLKLLMEPEFWPDGVAVRRYTFPRKHWGKTKSEVQKAGEQRQIFSGSQNFTRQDK